MAALIAFSVFSIGAFTAEPTRLEKWEETHNYDNEISIKIYFYFDNFLISFMNPVIHYKNDQLAVDFNINDTKIRMLEKDGCLY